MVVLGNMVNSGGNIANEKSCVTDINGREAEIANNNTLLGSREYVIEMEDGMMDRIFANKIARNIYLQLDDEGREIMKFREI